MKKICIPILLCLFCFTACAKSQAGAIAGDRGLSLYTKVTSIITTNAENETEKVAPAYTGQGAMSSPANAQLSGEGAPQTESAPSSDVYDFVVSQADDTTPSCDMNPSEGAESFPYQEFRMEKRDRYYDEGTPLRYAPADSIQFASFTPENFSRNYPPNNPPQRPTPPDEPTPPIVPEPSTLALIVLGLGGLFVKRMKYDV